MANDRKRRVHNASGWTPQDPGLSAAGRTIAAMAVLIGDLAGSRGRRPDRYPRPVQGSAEQRRRIRQQERLSRKRDDGHAHG